MDKGNAIPILAGHTFAMAQKDIYSLDCRNMLSLSGATKLPPYLYRALSNSDGRLCHPP